MKTTNERWVTEVWFRPNISFMSTATAVHALAQGCGLGRDISVSRRTNVSSWFRLGSRAIASRRDVLCRRAPCIL